MRASLLIQQARNKNWTSPVTWTLILRKFGLGYKVTPSFENSMKSSALSRAFNSLTLPPVVNAIKKAHNDKRSWPDGFT